jgi:hypothetical protein
VASPALDRARVCGGVVAVASKDGGSSGSSVHGGSSTWRSNAVGYAALRGEEVPGGGEGIHGGGRRKIWSEITSLILRMRFQTIVVNLESGATEVIQNRGRGGKNWAFLSIR